MAKKIKPPAYREHKLSGQAIVTFSINYKQKAYYLGPYGSTESHARYHSLIAEYLASDGKQFPEQSNRQIDEAITVRHLCDTVTMAVDNGEKKLERLVPIAKALKESFGTVGIQDFGPVLLKRFRDELIEKGNTRRYINSQIAEVRRIFRYGLSIELIGPDRLVALDSLEALSPATAGVTPDAKPREAVAWEVVAETLPHCSPQVQAIILTLVATGCRPSEAFRMTPATIDTSGDSWIYRPSKHKTEAHLAGPKVIPIPKPLEAVLKPFFNRPPEAHLFSAIESRAWFEWNRSDPETRSDSFEVCHIPAESNETAQKASTNADSRVPRPFFTKDSLNRHIRRICDREKIEHWTPYQLRHLGGTIAAQASGMAGAGAVLGHLDGKVTKRYVHDEKQRMLAGPAVVALGEMMTRVKGNDRDGEEEGEPDRESA